MNNEKIFHKEKIGLIRSIIKLEIENFLCEDERFLIPGDEKMTDEENEFLKRIAHEVTKKFDDEERERILKEGKKEGIEEGKKEGIVEVAKNLKGKLPPEEIAKCTGLSLSTILLL